MTQQQMKQRGMLYIFASYYKPHWKLFALDMACALVICVIDLTFPLVSRMSMQQLLPAQAYRAFFVVMALMAAAYVLKGGMYFIVTYWGHLLGVHIEADIRADLFSHMQRLSFSFYDKNRTGQLMSRVTGDLFEISELAHHGPEDFFISTVTIVGAFCVMLTIRWELALIVFAVIPLFVLFTAIQRKRMAEASREVKVKLAGINGEVESSISGMRTAKAFANETAEIRKFEVSNDAFRGAKRGYYRAMAIYQSGMEFAMGILSVLVIAAGGVFIMRGGMDYIDLITFSLYVTTFITPIRKLSNFVEQFMQGMAGFKRFVELMRTDPAVEDAPGAKELTDVKGQIDLDDVTFRYDAAGPAVLSHVSLHVAPGETVAVVGPSGGGKSTLCQLIPRFYDVSGGAVRIDGHALSELRTDNLMDLVSFVFQEAFMLDDTLYENIRLGRPNATREQVEAAGEYAMALGLAFQIRDDMLDIEGDTATLGKTVGKDEKSEKSTFPSLLGMEECRRLVASLTDEAVQAVSGQPESAFLVELARSLTNRTN